jgi:hypothetical protein
MDVESVNLLIISENNRVLEALIKNEEISDQIKLIICNYFVQLFLHGNLSKEKLNILIGDILYNIIKNNPSFSKKAFNKRTEGTRRSNESHESDFYEDDRARIGQRLCYELNGWNFWIWNHVTIIQTENIIIVIDVKSYDYVIHWGRESTDDPIEGTLTTFESISKIIKDTIQKQKNKGEVGKKSEKLRYSNEKNEAKFYRNSNDPSEAWTSWRSHDHSGFATMTCEQSPHHSGEAIMSRIAAHAPGSARLMTSEQSSDHIITRLVNEFNGWNFWIWNDVTIIQIENIIMAIDAKIYKYIIHWKERSHEDPIEGNLTTFESISEIIKEIIQKQKKALRAKKQASSQSNEETRSSDEKNETKIYKEDTTKIVQRLVFELNLPSFSINNVVVIRRDCVVIVIDTILGEYKIDYGSTICGGTITTFETIFEKIKEILAEMEEDMAVMFI